MKSKKEKNISILIYIALIVLAVLGFGLIIIDNIKLGKPFIIQILEFIGFVALMTYALIKDLNKKNINNRKTNNIKVQKSQKVKDEIFGELEYENNYGYYGKVRLNFFDIEYDVKICIKTSNEKIEEIQYETYTEFIKKFKQIEDDVISNLLKYYNSEEKNSYGPDDEEENKKWWPDINTKEDMIRNIHFDEIIIQEGFLLKNERCIYVLFKRDWGGPDTDDNGVAVEIINEKVTGVGYKDIAY